MLLASQGDAALMGHALIQVCMASDETVLFKPCEENSDGPSFMVEALHLELTIGVHSNSRGLRTLPTGREWLKLSPLNCVNKAQPVRPINGSFARP